MVKSMTPPTHPRACEALTRIIEESIKHLYDLYDISLKGFPLHPFPTFVTDNAMARINLNRRAGHTYAMVQSANSQVEIRGRDVAIIVPVVEYRQILEERGLNDKVKVYELDKLAEQSRGFHNPDIVYIENYSHIVDQIPWDVIEGWYDGTKRKHGVFIGLS